MFEKISNTDEQLISDCRSLNLYKYIGENLDTFLLEMSEQKATPREVLSTFLSKICSERDHNKAVMQLQRASLPSDASFDNFDFSASHANETLLRELCECRWVANHKNIVFQGDPGLGKTHLACALGREALNRGYSTLFISANDLIAKLDKARKEDVLDKQIKQLRTYKVLIIDELGIPVREYEHAASLMYTLIHARDMKASTIITSNRELCDWHKYLGHDRVSTNAWIDRFVGNGFYFHLTGPSYRLKGLETHEIEFMNDK